MNHRQWKKNFKKKHGRNPYKYEDKKYKYKSIAKCFIDFANRFNKAIKEAAHKLGVVFEEVGKALKEY